MVDKFARKLERTMLLAPATQVMLVLPYKPTEPQFRQLMNRNRWSLVTFLPERTKVFDKPKKDDPFTDKKESAGKSIQNIVCLQFSPSQNKGCQDLEAQLEDAFEKHFKRFEKSGQYSS